MQMWRWLLLKNKVEARIIRKLAPAGPQVKPCIPGTHTC